MGRRLSKSRYVAGVQCHKLLWLKVNEPDAEELQPNKVLQDLFDQGRQVGKLATEEFPGGVLIDFPYNSIEERLAATREAIDGGAPAIFEAAFLEHDTLVAIDVLERLDGGWGIVEVKSSTGTKDVHYPDAAVQKYVAERAGLDILRVEIMHLNKEHRRPDENTLFARTDITTEVDEHLPGVAAELDAQLAMLQGDMPDVPIGAHCGEGHDCPFFDRCWPGDRDHIKKLYRVGISKAAQYMDQEIHKIADYPLHKTKSFTIKRQVKSLAEDRMIVEPTLSEALEEFDCKMGFLDFEAIGRALPPWDGMKPWQQEAAQFSYHEDDGSGGYTHSEFLAEGPEDCRPKIAEALVKATANADRVATYTHYEKTRIKGLREAVPELDSELEELQEKLLDMHPVIVNNVYHPDFMGSFSLKYILTPLVPELTYDDLIIVDGMLASVEIARLLFVADRIKPEEKDRVRRELLDYCERDTLAMVKLLERLRELVT